MNISVLTVFPELYTPFLETSLIDRARAKNIVHFSIESFFSHAQPKERIDAPSFGHGSGMLIKPEIVQKAVESQEQRYGPAYKIFFSPQGKKLNQRLLTTLSKTVVDKHLMLVTSRYEGMDTRVEEEYADIVLSIGDYVLMGGDIPAMAFLEGFLRLIPGVVGKKESVEHESFTGPFVDYPEYTAPVTWKGHEVPAIIRSGNHELIRQWREQRAVQKTVISHFDWLRSYPLSEKQKKIVQENIPPHYVVLMHDQILLPNKQIGTSSVTSMDIHDIARSSKTFGIKKYFIVTPLHDQQRIVQRLLDFWNTDCGIDYNQQRHEAISLVEVISSLDQVIAAVEKLEGKAPLLVATSARSEQMPHIITYYDQEQLWSRQKPVIFVFGTAKGLSEVVINRCNYLLMPVEGFSSFNHLSVRSAVAIILDRWFGINTK